MVSSALCSLVLFDFIIFLHDARTSINDVERSSSFQLLTNFRYSLSGKSIKSHNEKPVHDKNPLITLCSGYDGFVLVPVTTDIKF